MIVVAVIVVAVGLVTAVLALIAMAVSLIAAVMARFPVVPVVLSR